MPTVCSSSPTLVASTHPSANSNKMSSPLNQSNTGRSRSGTAFDQELDDLERSKIRPTGMENEHRAWKYQADNYFPREPSPPSKVEKLYRSCCCGKRRGMAAWIVGVLVFTILLVVIILKVAVPHGTPANSNLDLAETLPTSPIPVMTPASDPGPQTTITVTILATLSGSEPHGPSDLPIFTTTTTTATTTATETKTDIETSTVSMTSISSGESVVVTSKVTLTTTTTSISTSTWTETITRTITERNSDDDDRGAKTVTSILTVTSVVREGLDWRKTCRTTDTVNRITVTVWPQFVTGTTTIPITVTDL